MTAKSSRKDAERRRLEAMALLDQGCRQSEVAQRLGVTPGAVSQWVKAFRRGGPDALKARVHPGPEPKLNDDQLERLAGLLLQGAKRHGFPTNPWTLIRITEVIQRNFGVTYDPSGVWYLLNRLGWWRKRERRRATQ